MGLFDQFKPWKIFKGQIQGGHMKANICIYTPPPPTPYIAPEYLFTNNMCYVVSFFLKTKYHKIQNDRQIINLVILP